MIANYINGTPSGTTGDDDVFTRFAYTDGLRTKLWVDLDGDNTEDAGDQVTTYTYGTAGGGATGDSEIATGHLLSKVVYPEQVGSQAEADRRTLHAYNAQSQLIWMKDHEANVMEYDYDDLGRQTQQRATTLSGDFDSAVLRIATTYDSLGRRQLVTQYNNAAVGSGTVVDEVKFTYDEWGNLTDFDQDHNSTVATGGSYLYGIDFAYETAGSGTENGRNTLRRTQLTMPNGAYVQYEFSSAHALHDAWASRVSWVKVDADGSGGGSAITVAEYSYNGTGHVVRTDYLEPDVMSLAYAAGSPNAYGNLDRFGRVVTSQWTADRTTDHNFFDVDVYYDRASNITWVDDTVLGGWDYEYTIDGLNRLTQAERGTASGGPPPTTLSSLQFDQQWTLDQVGNWDIAKLDRNGDTDFVDTGDYNDDRTHNDVNELTARDTDDNGTDNFTLTYFKTGAMKNDGENYKYVWDAFGRLKEVLDRSDDSLVAEYTYNGLGFRTSEHHDTDTDGDVDGNDATYHFVFDERWRIVATYRNDDANPKEQFVYHCAGAGGYGSSSYIDAVILRDVDLSTAWNAQANALDARHYYCQNWRADVSVIIDDSATLVERIMYSPYGVPFGIPVGDIVTNATSAEPSEGIVGAGDYTELTTTYWGSSYNIADLDNDGDVDSADETILWNNYGAVMGWGALSDTHNRLGYAGYVFDEALAGTKWHVRHRVLESVLGRWLSRDPSGYDDGTNLVQYVGSIPTVFIDPIGLKRIIAVFEGQDFFGQFEDGQISQWWDVWNAALGLERPSDLVIHFEEDASFAEQAANKIAKEYEITPIVTPFGLCGQLCDTIVLIGHSHGGDAARKTGFHLDKSGWFREYDHYSVRLLFLFDPIEHFGHDPSSVQPISSNVSMAIDWWQDRQTHPESLLGYELKGYKIQQPPGENKEYTQGPAAGAHMHILHWQTGVPGSPQLTGIHDSQAVADLKKELDLVPDFGRCPQ